MPLNTHNNMPLNRQLLINKKDILRCDIIIVFVVITAQKYVPNQQYCYKKLFSNRQHHLQHCSIPHYRCYCCCYRCCHHGQERIR